MDMEKKYKPIWDTDKDAYMRRYAKANRSHADFDKDIHLYFDHIEEIHGEEAVQHLQFLHIDQQPLKQVSSRHFDELECTTSCDRDTQKSAIHVGK